MPGGTEGSAGTLGGTGTAISLRSTHRQEASFFGWAIARRILELRLEERVSERTRIAQALHDTPLQSFQGLMLQLQVVENLLPPRRAKEKLALERADQAIAEGRDAVYDLRSSATTTNDLS